MTGQRIAVFDLDGTVTRHDTYVAFLLRFLRAHPARWARTATLPAAVAAHRLGLRDNTWLKARFLERVVGGSHRSAVEAVVEAFLATVVDRDLRPGALAALKAHRERGDRLVLASASFDFYVEPLASRLGFHAATCTRSHWHEDVATGSLDGPNCYGAAKLERLVHDLGRTAGGGVTAYSDHHSDLPLLTWAERGVAVNPTARLARLAPRHGIELADWSRPSREAAESVTCS